MKKAVEVRDLSFSYPGETRKILDHADFTLEYGEFAVLSGISGEGKTTLLGLLNGVIPFLTPGKREGKIFLAGEDCTDRKAGERAFFAGTVLQNADEQIVYEKAADEAAFGCENLNLPPEEIEGRVDASLKLLRIAPDSSTRTLSGGQKQRLITAATLAMGQRILFLDEPLANLDRAGALLLLQTLKDLTKQGCAVLLIEHRLDLVLPFADSVYRLRQGKIERVANVPALLAENRRLLPASQAQTGGGSPLVELAHIRYAPGKTPLLRDISLSVREGERVWLLGENGCGTTTLLRLMARLIRPDGGAYRQSLLPEKGRRPSARWFRAAGYVYQNPSYQLFMPTVRDELAVAAPEDAYAVRMAELFGLSELLDRHPHALSEGQKRRLGIAAVLAGQPRLVFLDEPTVGQDAENLKRIGSALQTLRQETGMATVTVTHDIRCAAALCDRALLLADGVIAAQGKAHQAENYLSGQPLNQ